MKCKAEILLKEMDKILRDKNNNMWSHLGKYIETAVETPQIGIGAFSPE